MKEKIQRRKFLVTSTAAVSSAALAPIALAQPPGATAYCILVVDQNGAAPPKVTAYSDKKLTCYPTKQVVWMVINNGVTNASNFGIKIQDFYDSSSSPNDPRNPSLGGLGIFDLPAMGDPPTQIIATIRSDATASHYKYTPKIYMGTGAARKPVSGSDPEMDVVDIGDEGRGKKSTTPRGNPPNQKKQ